MFGDALKMDADAFRGAYGVTKPEKDTDNVVVYCRSGARSSRALVIAHNLGYVKVRNYRGSWLEWSQSM